MTALSSQSRTRACGADTEMDARTSDEVIKTLLLRHSFVTQFKSFVRSRIPELNFNLNLDPKEVMIQYSGKHGATVESLKECQLSVVEDFEPHFVILDIGTNDLALPSSSPEKLASAIVELVHTLLTAPNIRHIVVSQNCIVSVPHAQTGV